MMRAVLAALMLCASLSAHAEVTSASCYGREGGQTRTATGASYDPSRLTAAYWFAPIGTMIRVVNLGSGRSVTVRVNDRGPAKYLVRRGRRIDLSLGSCRALGFSGIARVSLEVVGR